MTVFRPGSSRQAETAGGHPVRRSGRWQLPWRDVGRTPTVAVPADGYDPRAVGIVYDFPNEHNVDVALRRAIGERRLVTFTLHGLPRRAEPHDYGVIHGEAKLFFYQVGGRSRSGRPFGWRWALLSEIQQLQLLHQTFRGSRDSRSGRHVDWDRLIASVSSEARET
jgi:hypothetical protein